MFGGGQIGTWARECRGILDPLAELARKGGGWSKSGVEG